ncbi:hypothetical protein ICV35_26775 [Rhodococcus ruber]|uniref:hypothetical protein n=1 Tax=Rhodococcus ruber TaxID=1830 RepID=UPI001781AE13|nr:hypothetical protein [Rhodococcus ruber]MBD8057245.1 hypothetical protein [Rhodococcus ruber]
MGAAPAWVPGRWVELVAAVDRRTRERGVELVALHARLDVVEGLRPGVLEGRGLPERSGGRPRSGAVVS